MKNITFIPGFLKQANKGFLLLVFCFSLLLSANAQTSGEESDSQNEITGKVMDLYTRAPIAEVSVQVKGTEISVKTEEDGTYKIEIPENASTLTFTLDGYRTVNMDIDGRENIEVSMGVDNTQQQETVW